MGPSRVWLSFMLFACWVLTFMLIVKTDLSLKYFASCLLIIASCMRVELQPRVAMLAVHVCWTGSTFQDIILALRHAEPV